MQSSKQQQTCVTTVRGYLNDSVAAFNLNAVSFPNPKAAKWFYFPSI